MSAESAVRIACPAKVNLFLEVLSRRGDGYHEILTVLQAIDLADTLQARRASAGVSLSIEGGASLPTGPGNLAYDAAARFLDLFAPGEGVALRLTKRIPDRAGLGGGSSDAAGALLALDRLFGPVPANDLVAIGAGLGSDVPFFLLAATAIARGRGEDVRALPPPPPTWLVLFLPPFGLSTPAVYAEVRIPDEGARRSPDELLATLAGPGPWPGLHNRLEEAAARREPAVTGFRAGVESRLEPGETLLLTGSGSAFFVPVRDATRAAHLASGWNRSGPGRALAVRTRDLAPVSPPEPA